MTDTVVEVLVASPITVVEVPVDAPSVVEANVPGPQGPAGPDGWSVPIQKITATGSTVAIDYSLGKHVRLTLAANVTTVTITGWPPADQFARLTLEIENTGNFAFFLPATIKWSNGVPPSNSVGAGKSDTWIVTTSDGGATLKGYLVGVNLS